MAKDYYKILGVSRNATKEEIKKAYKKLAKLYHPDLHKGDKEKEEKFKEINEAYRVLSDDKLRANYDRFGTAENFGTGFQAGNFGFDFRDFGFDFDIDNIFEDFFGFPGFKHKTRSRRKRRGEDLYYDIEITLEEAAMGTTKNLKIEMHEKCTHCNGTGAEELRDCPHCGGTGYIQKTRRTPFGIFSTTTTCQYCNGTGKIIAKKCPYCNGKGYIKKQRTVEVKIPAGIEDKTSLRIRGAGNLADTPGDLYVVVHIKEHPLFKRVGNNLYYNTKISFPEAALGTRIEVPTITSKKAELRIPAGTQPGTVFKLRKLGIKDMRTGQLGDLFVKVEVDIPKKLTRKQRELIKKLQDTMKK